MRFLVYEVLDVWWLDKEPNHQTDELPKIQFLSMKYELSQIHSLS